MYLGWRANPIYDEKHKEPPKGTIPLTAAVQLNKGNTVRPVLNFWELNSYINQHTTDADVCSEKIREWRRCGQDVGIIDLLKANLKFTWTVHFGRTRMCLGNRNTV